MGANFALIVWGFSAGLRRPARNSSFFSCTGMSAEELLTRHQWLNRYKGELVGWNRLIDELACQIEQRYAEHDQS